MRRLIRDGACWSKWIHDHAAWWPRHWAPVLGMTQSLGSRW